jgi:hypothetical protein
MTAPIEDRFGPPLKAQRVAAIARAVGDSEAPPHLIPAEAGYLEAPVARLPQELLLYRFDNGRLLSELNAAAAARGITFEALEAKAARPKVQELLHELLLEKAKDPAAPIQRELETYRRQTEPLLVQADGVVVNGNRRLAAMRELLARDSERYASFATPAAAILPERLSREAVEFIEAALQMAPGLKLEYNWINRRLKLRRHSRDLPAAKIVAAYRLRGPDQMEEELAELELAEEYLAWIGRREDYARIAANELHFAALRHQLARASPPRIAELWRLVGFAMIAAAERLERPIEHYYPFADPSPNAARQWPLRALAHERGILSAEALAENRAVEPSIARRLRVLLEDSGNAETIARAAMSHIDVLRSNESRILGASQALFHLQRARRNIEAVDVSAITPSQRRGLRAEVAALLESLRLLDPQAPSSEAAGGWLRRLLQIARR